MRLFWRRGRPLRRRGGGASDLIGRKVAERLDTILGRRVVVGNKPSGGTVIGSQAALAAAADGNTVLLVAASFLIVPQLLAKSRKVDATFASFGNGSSGHLGFELLRRELGIDLLRVPKRGAPAL